MALFDIINISDPYTMEADDWKVAVITCAILGEGHYALKEIDGEREMPILLFGYDEKWFPQEFGTTFEELLKEVMDTKLDAFIACFESVLVGSPKDRQIYQEALALIVDPKKRKRWQDQWHVRRCSSLNDIGRRAWGIAEMLRRHHDQV